MSKIKVKTQLTSKTTAVVYNDYRGIVQTVALVDAQDTGFEFTINNSKSRTSNQVIIQGIYAGTTGFPVVTLKSQVKGAFTVKVQNIGTAVLNGALQVSFKIV